MSADQSAPTGLKYSTLRHRRDFLAAARAKKAVTPGFVLQGRNRHDGMTDLRVGFTASKKVGNAVCRNRAKRRLRALARNLLHDIGQPGHDYVLIARRDSTANLSFLTLERDLSKAISRLHRPAQ